MEVEETEQEDVMLTDVGDSDDGEDPDLPVQPPPFFLLLPSHLQPPPPQSQTCANFLRNVPASIAHSLG